MHLTSNMNSKEISAEELAANERFQNYCRASNKEDVAYWEQWMKEYPEKVTLVTEARSLVLFLSTIPSEEEIASEYSKFRSTINPNKKGTESKIRSIEFESKKQKPNIRWIGAIASILFFLIAVWKFGPFDKEQSYEVITDFGEVQTHLLPDGSKVILNANSTITYKDWTANKKRSVQLVGEAFFEVQRNSTQPKFIVETKKGSIEVVGTSFNVLQRADNFEVSLLEGAVALHVPNFPMINMTPGESVFIEKDQYKRLESDVDALSAWRFQRIVFKEVSIKKVIQRLADEYDFDIRVQQPQILERKISASIPKNDPALLLKAISEIYNLKIEQQLEKVYVIK